jgi:hypothetical protein
LSGCAAEAPPVGPFTLTVVNASPQDVVLSWTGPRAGGTTVGGCEVALVTFDDGLWVIRVVGTADAAQFPMRVETAAGGRRPRTVALDPAGRIDVDARVAPGRPCPID